MMKQKYYDWHSAEPYFMDIIEPFLKSDIVLDVGCGSGWVGESLKKFNDKVIVIGSDIDLVGLRQSKGNEEPILSDAKKMPFKNHTFDGIIAKDILEHSSETISIMIEFNRILKCDGCIYISVPDVKSKTFWDDYTHIRPYNKKSLTHLLEDTGFSIEKLWYNANWPGLGIFMRIFKINKLPFIIKLLATIGIRRQNIIVIGKKNQNIRAL